MIPSSACPSGSLTEQPTLPRSSRSYTTPGDTIPTRATTAQRSHRRRQNDEAFRMAGTLDNLHGPSARPGQRRDQLLAGRFRVWFCAGQVGVQRWPGLAAATWAPSPTARPMKIRPPGPHVAGVYAVTTDAFMCRAV